MYSFFIATQPGFGEVLRGHRRAARLTLEQLAEVSGVSARTLSDLERGRSTGPQHRTVTALADALVLAGLLVVAVSVVNADDSDPTTRENRTVLAGSAFVGLVDIFLVSIVALTGGSVVLALSSLAMAAVGLLATRRLVPRARRAGNFSRGFRTRNLNIAFALISAGGYSVQLGLGLALLANTRSAALQRALVLVIVALY